MIFGRRKKEGPFAGVNLLEVAPVRVAEWTENEGGKVVVDRPLPRSKGLRRLGDLITHYMASPKIRLDEVGTFAWSRFDGSWTVGRVANALRDEFGEAVEPVEERLGRLVQLLYREGLVAYPALEDVAPDRVVNEPRPPDPAQSNKSNKGKGGKPASETKT